MYLSPAALRVFKVHCYIWCSRQFILLEGLLIPNFVIIRNLCTDIFTEIFTDLCLLYIMITLPNNFHTITLVSFNLRGKNEFSNSNRYLSQYFNKIFLRLLYNMIILPNNFHDITFVSLNLLKKNEFSSNRGRTR